MGGTEKKVINIMMAMTIAFAFAICFVNAQHAFAAEPVATITRGGVETSYNSLKEACTNAVNGDTIKLIADEEASEPFTIEKNITVNLNGHSYLNTHGNDMIAAITIRYGAEVTFMDSSKAGTGEMIGQNRLFYVDINDHDWSSEGKLTIQNGTYTCVGTNYKSEYAVIYNRGTTTINGASIINEGVNSTIYNSRNSYYGEEHRANLTITDATVQSSQAYGINSYGNTILNDVEIITNAPKPEGSGTYFALICAGGYTEINGNTTIKANNAGIGALGIYGTEIIIKDGLIDGDVITGDSPDITVEGGVFAGNWEITDSTWEPVEIRGGLFKGRLYISGWYDNEYPEVRIKDGTFEGEIAASTYAKVRIEGGKFSGESLWSSWYATIRASGGYFKYDPVKDHILEGYKFTDNVDGPDGYRYAVMPDSYCVVKYDTNGGNAIDSVGVTKGDDLPIPATNPKKDKDAVAGIFDGWYYDKELTKPVQDDDTVEGDVTLHAAWKGDLYIGVRSFYKGGVIQLTVDGEYKGAGTEFEFYNDNGDAVRQGTAFKVEAKPNPGHRFGKWQDANSKETITNNAVYEFTYGETDGYFAYFEPILVEKIRFKTLKSSVAEGEKLQLELTILPSDALIKTVTWRSSDENVLKVNESGRVTGINEGSAFVTARANDGSGVSVSRKITVTHTHDLNLVEATEPTCTENGYKEHWKCSKCNKWFSDSNGQYEVAEDSDAVLLPAVGHQWGDGWSTVDEPTTEKDGLEKRTCVKDKSHTETRAIPKLDHTHDLSEVSKEEATCTESGHEKYYECSGCAAIYLDEEGTQQTSEGEIRIPASGHVKGEPEKSEPTPATCDSVGGYNLTTKCKNCGSVLKVERVITPIDPNTHDWDEWITNEDGLEERVCLNDTSHMETRISNAKIVLSAADFTYNGRVQKPSIKKIGNIVLKSGTDYAVSDVSSKNVGAYTVTITGKGDYTGVAKATYRINPKGTSIKKPRKAKKAITVKWKRQKSKMSTSRITGYQIKLATDSNFTQNVKTVNVKGYKKTSKKVKMLIGKTKYYVKVRTYKTAGGTTCYSGWSKVKSVKTK